MPAAHLAHQRLVGVPAGVDPGVRADHEAVRARPRAGARQTAALHDPGRCYHAQAFDEVVSDIVTVVTPLLVVGSVVLALLSHFGADTAINTALTPVTLWWLGLPIVLGVPILFGILRKELSLLMIYQALGTQEIVPLLDWVQIFTFLVFLTFYIPCLSTFAVMLRTLGRRDALFSVLLSVVGALALAGLARVAAEGLRLIV